MLSKNEEYIVNIVDNGFQGEGIAKIDGFPVFIENAIKGEKIKIKILKIQSSFAYGKIIEILEKSEKRQEIDCNSYKKCGGCNLRHINYDETLVIKRNIVENCLYKALGKKILVNNTIGMNNPFFYRNKLLYPVGINKENKPTIGLYTSRSHDIVEIEKCYIQNELCQKIAKDIFNFAIKNNISIYNEKTLKGTLRHIVIRIGVKTKEVLVTIVLNDNNFKQEKEFVEVITKKYPEVKSIVKNFNTKNTNVILGNKNEIIMGNGYIYDILGEYKFKISPLSFYQINPSQTEILYNTAIKFIENENKQNIALDLYCGIGTIGIWASKYFNKVYGIEIVEDAINDAKENAKINGIQNIEFYLGDVEQVLPKIIEKEKIKPNVVFVDPPRKGLDIKTIETLLYLKPEKIIYISCNPATLARDLKNLEQEYLTKEVQPIDMFPWTAHIECVAILNRI
jgi:23S rRNA (uracil1939-C5)-methyltransferase